MRDLFEIGKLIFGSFACLYLKMMQKTVNTAGIF